VFEVAARRRITPPDGSYGVFLFGKAVEGVETRVDIDRGRVIIPSPVEIKGGPLTRLEFIIGDYPMLNSSNGSQFRSVNKWH
jgi:hypothetical protein